MKKQFGKNHLIVPLPAVLVGTYDDDGTPNAMTAAWAAPCCHTPPCLGVAVRDSRLTFHNIVERGTFTLNVPRATQAAEVDYLGIVSGKKEPNKLSRADLSTERGTEVDAPIIVPCPINVELKLVNQLALGTHTWFVGEIVATQVDKDCLSADGKIDMQKLDPLSYATNASAYHRLGPKVAQAFSAGKKLTQS